MVFVPFISTRSSIGHDLSRRQTEDPNRDGPVVGTIAITGEQLEVSTESNGTTTTTTLPDGDPYAGRAVGGGTRDIIYGTKWYGSGYPDKWQGKGAAERDFPFFFWPITWGFPAEPAYIFHDDYGTAANDERPGGYQEYTVLRGQDNTLRIVSDALTTRSLVLSVEERCRDHLRPGGLETSRFAGVSPETKSGSRPRPAQVIQYYRASTVALTLDQFNGNNSQFLSPDENVEETVFVPMHYPDHALIDCVNRTIGEMVPLVVPNGGISGEATSAGVQVQSDLGMVLAVGLVWVLSRWFR